MASLINRIQRAFLGSAGPEKVRALLTELAIPAGGSGENALREARRGFLRPISDEAILRDGLSSLGLSGGGTGARPLSKIRSAILHNLVDSETTLRDGLNDLLEAGDLAGEGGGGAPEWLEDMRGPDDSLPTVAGDFTTDSYLADGAEATLADIIEAVEGSTTVSGDGLAENSSFVLAGAMKVAAMDYANAPVFLIEIFETDTEDTPALRMAYEDADETEVVLLTILSGESYFFSIPAGEIAMAGNAISGQTGRIVVSPGPSNIKVSVNGGAVETFSVDDTYWDTLTGRVKIGYGFPNQYDYIKRIAVYPTMSNANMALLSAVT